MRLFVALDVDAGVRRKVERALDGLRGRDDRLRWTRPDGWHITLAFLGKVEAAVDVVEAAVARGVADAAVGPLELRLGEPGRFGRRVGWLGVEDEPPGAVTRLGDAVQAALEEAALPVDRKDVHPHLTLVRPKGQRRLPEGLVEELPRPEGAWRVEDAVLYRSVTDPDGARYEELARIPL